MLFFCSRGLAGGRSGEWPQTAENAASVSSKAAPTDMTAKAAPVGAADMPLSATAGLVSAKAASLSAKIGPIRASERARAKTN